MDALYFISMVHKQIVKFIDSRGLEAAPRSPISVTISATIHVWKTYFQCSEKVCFSAVVLETLIHSFK